MRTRTRVRLGEDSQAVQRIDYSKRHKHVDNKSDGESESQRWTWRSKSRDVCESVSNIEREEESAWKEQQKANVEL